MISRGAFENEGAVLKYIINRIATVNRLKQKWKNGVTDCPSYFLCGFFDNNHSILGNDKSALILKKKIITLINRQFLHFKKYENYRSLYRKLF